MTPALSWKVKEVGDLMTGEPAIEAPVNDGQKEDLSLARLNGLAQDGLAMLSSAQFNLDLLIPQLPSDEHVQNAQLTLQSWNKEIQRLSCKFTLSALHFKQETDAMIVKCITTSWQLGRKIDHRCLQREDMHSGDREGPYQPTTVVVPAIAATDDSPEVPQHTAVDTILNMTPDNKAHFQAEKETIFLLLTGIGDEIYSTVDAYQTANEIWIAIERPQ
ncbi:hypothetical protein Tco_0842319 [Tanacetum coccineum]|uniref:Uncharacterized protein n=1 Tax=Tanacetum coccineum TaxID=301880 RepID=A0ABQ5B2F1_9ASTR